MSLRLVVEDSPHRQPVAELAHPGGEISIGRGPEADWRLEDPEMFISRQHCLVTGREGRFEVTDVSRGGVFVDGAEAPLGAGRSCELRHGMRLRLGDVVLRVEIAEARPAEAPLGRMPPSAGDAAAPGLAGGGFAADDFFRRGPPEPAAPPRPASLPEPFDAPRAAERGFGWPPEDDPEEARVPPLGFADDFALDPLPTPPEAPPPGATRGRRGAAAPDPFEDPFAQPGPEPGGDHRPTREVSRRPDPAIPVAVVAAPEPPPPRPAAPVAPAAPARAAGAADVAIAEALVRGMGLAGGPAPDIGPAEAEALGRQFRALVEGLTLSLRARAREKQSLRVAQTVFGAADANPLKVLPTTEEVLAALIGPRRPGYLDAEAAIAAAQRDLADHQVRSWLGLQAALRRMIDRFDPEAIEAEMDSAGRLRALLAGGRGAFLWQLYRDRFQAIAKAAEDRFLGEVGGDFREAYEGDDLIGKEDRHG